MALEHNSSLSFDTLGQAVSDLDEEIVTLKARLNALEVKHDALSKHVASKESSTDDALDRHELRISTLERQVSSTTAPLGLLERVDYLTVMAETLHRDTRDRIEPSLAALEAKPAESHTAAQPADTVTISQKMADDVLKYLHYVQGYTVGDLEETARELFIRFGKEIDN